VHPRLSAISLILLVVAALTPAPATAEVKVAVVDVQRAILNTEQAKAFMAQIQQEFKKEEDEIRAIQSDAAAVLERLQKDGEVMSDAEKAKLEKQIQDKNNDYVYLRKKLQSKVDDRQRELFSGVDEKMQKAVEEIVKEGDYDVILPRQAALYVSELYDITNKVTEKLNALNRPASAAAAKP
jgi:outer membrane protein